MLHPHSPLGAGGAAAVYQDPWTWLVGAVDRSFMLLYIHVRRNTRRIMQLVIAFLPLMMLLVGSCKTNDAPGAYGSNAAPEQFRIALFPDRVNYSGDDYHPARGYISRARTYVSGAPESLARLTEMEISYLFGTPTLERRDAEARIWQYRTDGCVMDVYFYKTPDVAQGYNVSYVDFRTKEQLKVGGPIPEAPAAEKSQARCIRTLVSNGAEAPARKA